MYGYGSVHTTYRYEEIKHTEKRKLSCRNCDKTFTRQTTFTQTINPWNKNVEGEPKTRSEIWTELEEQGKQWEPEDICTKCKDV